MAHYPELENKVVLITGAGGALGTAVTRYFYEAKARLVLAEYRGGVLTDKFGDFDKERVLFSEGADVTDRADLEDLAKQVRESFGQLDIIINIVGGYDAGDPLHETSEDVWDKMMDMNAKSAFMVNHVMGKMVIGKDDGWGRIVNIAAKAGLSGGKNHSAYSASKAAVFRITESMSAELKGSGITVNAIMPTTLDTPANREAMPNADFSKWTQPASVAAVIGFLTSDDASIITGAAIPV